jgi:hypothetical protein
LWRKGRVVLLGDAAHCPSPFISMGTTSSFVGAYVPAGEISRNPGNLPQALAVYDRTLRPFVNKIQPVSRSCCAYASPRLSGGLLFPISFWDCSASFAFRNSSQSFEERMRVAGSYQTTRSSSIVLELSRQKPSNPPHTLLLRCLHLPLSIPRIRRFSVRDKQDPYSCQEQSHDTDLLKRLRHFLSLSFLRLHLQRLLQAFRTARKSQATKAPQGTLVSEISCSVPAAVVAAFWNSGYPRGIDCVLHNPIGTIDQLSV